MECNMTEKTTISAETKHAQNLNCTSLIDAVAEDRRLTPDKKETVLRFTKPEERVCIYTEEGGLMRRLLQHPEFQVERLRVVTEESWGDRIDPDDFNGGSITGIDGWGPIGLLSLKTSPRTTSQHAAIVSERVLRDE